MATSTLGFVETVRTMDRVASYPTLMSDLVRDSYRDPRDGGDPRRSGATASPASVCWRLVHIASAQALGERLDVLITYDGRMFDVARSVGLSVAAPGMR